MCGIAGFINFNFQETVPQYDWNKFTEPFKYRGPDDAGDWHLRGNTVVSFFHTRLSIIDLNPTGHQPMTSTSGKTTIVFNGEIYNYQQLKHELILAGFKFHTSSDTEVLLNGFECWGIHTLLHKIDGMFAFAMFDKSKEELFLARDRFGKKPLYFSTIDSQLVFSSDIRSFKHVKSLPLTIDYHALGYYFSEYSTPLENTIWNEVKKLKPSTYLKYGKQGIIESKSYWNLNYNLSCKLSTHEIEERAVFLLRKAVKKRLVSDVRVSALLSGGIDSSLIVALMAEQTHGAVRTYSVGFHEEGFNELPYARQVANRFGTDHTELIITPQQLNDIDSLILEYGEPFADSSMIPTYLMSKQISASEKVVLGGDGGDELFAGYDSYYFAYKYDQVKSYGKFYWLSRLLNNAFPSYRTELLKRLLNQTRYPNYTLLDRNFCFDKNDLRNLVDNKTFWGSTQTEHERVWNEYAPGSSHELINVLSASLKTRLLNDYLVKVDRASMYASVEMRSPFLDKDLAEFVATLRPDQIYKKGEPKAILKNVAKRYFPSDFIYRKKMGFGIPIGNWFKTDLAAKLREVMETRQTMVDLNYKFIQQLLDEHIKGYADHTEKLWSLYVFHIWASKQ